MNSSPEVLSSTVSRAVPAGERILSSWESTFDFTSEGLKVVYRAARRTMADVLSSTVSAKGFLRFGRDDSGDDVRRLLKILIRPPR